MRSFFPSLTLGTLLAVGVSGSVLLAQDQSAPPPASAQSPAASQGQQPVHIPNPGHQAKKMAKELGLSPGQVSQIEPILADRDQQMQGVRGDATLATRDTRDRKAKVRSIRRDSDSKIEAVLNDTQRQHWEQIKQNRKANKQQTGAPANS